MNKDERTKTKVAELMQIYDALPEEKLKVAADLIEQAAFMAITLEDLAEIISKEGVTEQYTNGANQSGRKISSNAKMYSALIGKYASITTKLLQLVPSPAPKQKGKNEHLLYAEREAAERQKQIRKEQERDMAITDAFCKAYKGKPQTVDVYRDFKEKWIKEHAEI